VTYDTRIIDVLEMFISLEVSAVPVVDRETSSVVDIFCKSDVIVSNTSLYLLLCCVMTVQVIVSCNLTWQ